MQASTPAPNNRFTFMLHLFLFHAEDFLWSRLSSPVASSTKLNGVGDAIGHAFPRKME